MNQNSILSDFVQTTYQTNINISSLKDYIHYQKRKFPIQFQPKLTSSSSSYDLQREYWTCSFHCPITNIVLDSSHIQPRPQLTYYQPPRQEDGVWYYAKKSWTQYACYARIFDHLPIEIHEQYECTKENRMDGKDLYCALLQANANTTNTTGIKSTSTPTTKSTVKLLPPIHQLHRLQTSYDTSFCPTSITDNIK